MFKVTSYHTELFLKKKHLLLYETVYKSNLSIDKVIYQRAKLSLRLKKRFHCNPEYSGLWNAQREINYLRKNYKGLELRDKIKDKIKSYNKFQYEKWYLSRILEKLNNQTPILELK